MKISKNFVSLKLQFAALVVALAAMFCGCSQIHIPESILRFQALKAEKTKKYSECDRLFTQLVKQNPKDDASLAALGHCKYHLNEFDSAIEVLTQAIKVNPKNDRAYDLRGLCKYKQKNYEAAIVDYEKALTLNPANPHTEEDLGNIYKKLGNRENALEHLFKAQMIYTKFGAKKDLKRVGKALDGV
ncbi:MAG: tetratricopeptide repeat protein [Candidatus Caenarcaniphilales bacterium]|nr:tetratricopeptide repeat protein [Candidatus Caenarcaniphilales bacterium]